MIFSKVPSRLTSHYITDPYAVLMHYKRAFKLLKYMRNRNCSVLFLGNKNNLGVDWKNCFEGIETIQGRCDESVIDSASLYYSLIVCMDPVLYAKYFRRVNVPVMTIATAKELQDYPEILLFTDYLLPAPNSRRDAALKQLLFKEYLNEASMSTDESTL